MKRFWIQRPCFYWGYETHALGRLIGRSWLAQTDPPFYYGHAVRICIGMRAYHFGLCRKAKRPFVRPAAKTPEEIGKWVY